MHYGKATLREFIFVVRNVLKIKISERCGLCFNWFLFHCNTGLLWQEFLIIINIPINFSVIKFPISKKFFFFLFIDVIRLITGRRSYVNQQVIIWGEKTDILLRPVLLHSIYLAFPQANHLEIQLQTARK